MTKEEQAAYTKAYREAHKTERKAYCDAHKEMIAETKAAYRRTHKHKIKEYNKEYNEKNPEYWHIQLYHNYEIPNQITANAELNHLC